MKRPIIPGPSGLGTSLYHSQRLEKLVAHDLLCFSHLRWDFVFQRPQHLLSRSARVQRVFYLEEPVWERSEEAWLELRQREGGVRVGTPHLPEGLSPEAAVRAQRLLVDKLLRDHAVTDFVAWYYTPMALPFSRHLPSAATVYDCMDELSNFKGAPRELRSLERELLERADVVFTGGRSLFDAKRDQHPNIHPFPSSIDVRHFARARGLIADPEDQRRIPRPRLGYFGVIDERMDLELLSGLAASRPEWHFVLVGPVTKIDPAELPQGANLHYLGPKPYTELPDYLAGWDVALLPFACNEATRFISPTKTPEYLAAGKPVVSTPIRDVVCPYGQQELVRIADTVASFAAAIEAALAEPEREQWLAGVDAFLASTSWESTWQQMMELVAEALPDHRLFSFGAGPAVRPASRASDFGVDD